MSLKHSSNSLSPSTLRLPPKLNHYSHSQLGDEDVAVGAATAVQGLVARHTDHKGARLLVLHHPHTVIEPLHELQDALLAWGLIVDGVSRDGVSAPVEEGERLFRGGRKGSVGTL